MSTGSPAVTGENLSRVQSDQIAIRPCFKYLEFCT
jgi:hypothetical protein